MKKLLQSLFILLFVAVSAMAQDRTVTGTVSSQGDGQPLPGVSVQVRGTKIGTQTGADGKFTIKLSQGQNALTFTFIGFNSKTVNVSSASVLNVSLEEDTKALSEVVIVGYGTQTKREITGSQATVKAADIANAPLLSPEQALQGRAAGVQVTQASGTPGGGISVRVRGPSSIGASNQPLYIVDGVPINTGSYTQLAAGGQLTNSLGDINPSDIESLEVLKDAAATAIYGSRASNGVVLITTKRGSNQPTRFSFNSYYGVQDVYKTLETITGPEYITLMNEAVGNWAATQGANPAGYNYTWLTGGLSSDPSAYPTTRWQDEIFRSAAIANYDLSIRGGNDRTKFSVSGSYFDQAGIVIGSGFKRYSGRINLDNKVSDKFTVGVSSSFSNSLTNRINNDNNIYGVVSGSILLGPHVPVFNANGTYGGDPVSSVDNPVASALETTFEAVNNRLFANTFAEYKFSDNLKLKSSFGIDYLSSRDRRFYPTTVNAGRGAKGSGAEGYNQEVNYINENILSFNKTFAGKHALNAIAGVTYQTSKYESVYASATGFPGNDIRRISAGAVKTDASSSGTSWGLVSYLARANYTFDDKYIIQGSVRVDGSSRFGANNRYATFPAASVAWRVNEENFLKKAEFISDLKLRASYGQTGNQEIGNFGSLGLFGVGAYIQTGSLAPTQLENADLTWETAESYNLGLDLGLFQNRISLTVDAYQRDTKELLLGQPLVGSSGFLSIQKNIGNVQNKGLEFGLNAVIADSKSFKWDANFNVAFNENEVTKLYGGIPFASGFASWVEQGQPLGAFRGYRVDRLFQSQTEISASPTQSSFTRPGDIKFKDLNGSNSITSLDQEIMGQGLPTYFGGLTNNLKYKNFDLSFFIQFSGGNQIYNNTRAFSEGMNSVFGQTAAVLNRWTPTNTNTNIPRAVYNDFNNNRRVSDRFLEDGDFIRLKNATIGYSLNPSLAKRLKLSSLRIYASGQNIYTKTKYSGLDPEVSTFSDTNTAPGTDFLTFPQARTFTFGINVGF
jgi:TonB-linked SusC/RagA family outer membrane protein